MGGGRQPNAAKSQFNSGESLTLVPKYFARVKSSIAVGIRQNQDSIAFLEIVLAAFVGVAFDDPQTASVIDFKCDRLVNEWISGEQSGRESFREADLASCLQRTRRMLSWRLGIDRMRRLHGLSMGNDRNAKNDENEATHGH